MGSLQATVVLPNTAGLHARSAAMVVKATTRFQATVRLYVNGRSARASSLMELLRLGARQGDAVRIEVEGPDAEDALDAFRIMMETGFGEG